MAFARTFPQGFLWGTATASYQVEGAVDEDGRGESMWDVFSHTPGKTLGGDTGDVADDHYHLYENDLNTMAQLGVNAYRFSFAWPRIQPTGSGEFNPRGFDFYDRIVDGLLERDIAPVGTLYHWDLPQALEDAGGWPNRDTAFRFAEYAQHVAEHFGDRLAVWTTFNEPWCSAFLGYASGEHAPGRQEAAASLAAAHHLNVAHGLTVPILRSTAKPDAIISITLNLHEVLPASDRAEDADAVRQIDAVGNRIFLDPIFRGEYPEDLISDTRGLTDWSFVHAGDLGPTGIIRRGCDVLGVNYYTTSVVRRSQTLTQPAGTDGSPQAASPWPGANTVEFVPQSGPETAMNWHIDPDHLRILLSRIAREYSIPVMVTENGAAFADEVSADGQVHDAARVDYLHSHIDAVARAIEEGVDVRGYFAWSLLDNFEWAFGYSRRFGIVRVDYDTQKRTVKDSGRFYSSVARTGEVEAYA